MKKKIQPPVKNLSDGNLKKETLSSDMLKRREALKRIALLAVGGIAGSVLLKSCEPYPDYSDYSDYYNNYYSNYYTDSYYYYDYYSVYSAYWDSK
jgi:hypothetical protein